MPTPLLHLTGKAPVELMAAPAVEEGCPACHLAPVVSVRIQGHGRAPDANLYHSLTVQKSLVHTATEGRPMIELLSQGLVSCVRVGIHVQQPHRAVSDDNRAAQRSGVSGGRGNTATKTL
jgi:hypothetical protein